MFAKGRQSTATLRRSYPSCIICNTVPKNNLHYICNSGRIVCDKCHSGDDDSNSSTKSQNKDSLTNGLVPEELFHRKKELAGGDNNNSLKSKLNRNIQETNCGKIKGSHYSTETTVGYRNVNFCDSISSSNELYCQDDQYPFNNNTYNIEEDEHIEIQRPVLCPVAECSKMIVIESVLLHFYFDHVKVPLLCSRYALDVQLDVHSISETSRCAAIIIEEDNTFKISKEILHRNASYSELRQCKNSTYLLMAAKFSIPKVNSENGKFKKNARTQTNIEDTLYYRFQFKSKIISSRIGSNRPVVTSGFKNSDIFIFWICKLKHMDVLYSIQLTGDDNRLSHIYKGVAIHIQNDQDIISMYNKAECLMVHGEAVNKLLNDKEQLNVNVALKRLD